jgi:hypothetical protein
VKARRNRRVTWINDIKEIHNARRNILMSVTLGTMIADLPLVNLPGTPGFFLSLTFSHRTTPLQDCLAPNQIGPHTWDARPAKAPSPPHNEDKAMGLGQSSGSTAASSLKPWPEHSKRQNSVAKNYDTSSDSPKLSLCSAEHRDHNDEPS